MKFTFEEIAKATDAQIIRCKDNSAFFGISTDTRKIKPDELYLPLKGENFDGHNFIEKAVKDGVQGYFTGDKNLISDDAKYILYVEDTLTAYLKLASYYKTKIHPVTIAITGSSGKTTTKEMTACVAEQKYKIHKSILNHNNEIGLCETMLSMPEDTEVLIVEMGMRGPGEIELLSKYAKPDIAIIANTGSAHIGRLGSVENIAKAKCEITKYLRPEGILLAHDTDLIKSTNTYEGQTVYLGLECKDLKDIQLNSSSCEFVYKNQKYKLNVEGRHNIQNALFAINAGYVLGIAPDLIAKGLQNYKPIEKRWEISNIGGYKIINDSYNSNPESLKAAISTFLATQKSPRMLVLGDMGELGKYEQTYHKEIGEFLNQYDDVKVITVGELAKYIIKGLSPEKQSEAVSFEDNKSAAEYILKNIPSCTVMLFKASRFMKFEEIIKELEKQ